MTDTLRFPFRFTRSFALAALPLGVRPDTCEVVVDDLALTIRFGRWTLETPRSNVVSAAVTGPYSWPKVIGPPHLSLADSGITFATNADQGACLRFGDTVPALLPVPWLRHAAATVTVEHPAALADLFMPVRGRDMGSLDTTIEAVHDDLAARTAAELRTRAKDLGIRGTSSMSKAELLVALEPDAVGVEVGGGA